MTGINIIGNCNPGFHYWILLEHFSTLEETVHGVAELSINVHDF